MKTYFLNKKSNEITKLKNIDSVVNFLESKINEVLPVAKNWLERVEKQGKVTRLNRWQMNEQLKEMNVSDFEILSEYKAKKSGFKIID